jgi:hypothetical protein
MKVVKKGAFSFSCVIVHATRTHGATATASTTPGASSSAFPHASQPASTTSAWSQRRKHSELEKEIDIAMKREPAIYEKK